MCSTKQTWYSVRDYVLCNATDEDWRVLLKQYGITQQTLQYTSHRDYDTGGVNSLLEVLNTAMGCNLIEVTTGDMVTT